MDCTRAGPTKNVKFRQALNYAVDKEGIIKSILFGAAEVMDAPDGQHASSATARSAPTRTTRPRPRQLIKEAGFEGASIKMFYPHRPLRAGRPGLARPSPATCATWASRSRPDDGLADLPGHRQRGAGQGHGRHLRARLGAGFLDTAQQMVQFRKSAWPPAGLASAHYTNPKVEDLLTKANAGTNEKERADQYAQAQQDHHGRGAVDLPLGAEVPDRLLRQGQGRGSIANEKFSCLYAEPA